MKFKKVVKWELLEEDFSWAYLKNPIYLYGLITYNIILTAFGKEWYIILINSLFILCGWGIIENWPYRRKVWYEHLKAK